MSWLAELLVWILSFLPEWVAFWPEDKDRAALVGTLFSFFATGALVSLLLGWTRWPGWVNWTVGFGAAFLYLLAVFCFSTWWTSQGKRTRAK